MCAQVRCSFAVDGDVTVAPAGDTDAMRCAARSANAASASADARRSGHDPMSMVLTATSTPSAGDNAVYTVPCAPFPATAEDVEDIRVPEEDALLYGLLSPLAVSKPGVTTVCGVCNGGSMQSRRSSGEQPSVAAADWIASSAAPALVPLPWTLIDTVAVVDGDVDPVTPALADVRAMSFPEAVIITSGLPPAELKPAIGEARSLYVPLARAGTRSMSVAHSSSSCPGASSAEAAACAARLLL
mmetsp:Transcript_166/g.659  ORF Transcript_166/g.659 Transcript_166/m.659 type:complete len:243 (-) Transcript_166:500-1228(-)